MVHREASAQVVHREAGALLMSLREASALLMSLREAIVPLLVYTSWYTPPYTPTWYTHPVYTPPCHARCGTGPLSRVTFDAGVWVNVSSARMQERERPLRRGFPLFSPQE